MEDKVPSSYSTPTFWPANTVLKLILRLPMQIRPQLGMKKMHTQLAAGSFVSRTDRL
jgi:hypothetical protein